MLNYYEQKEIDVFKRQRINGIPLGYYTITVYVQLFNNKRILFNEDCQIDKIILLIQWI